MKKYLWMVLSLVAVAILAYGSASWFTSELPFEMLAHLNQYANIVCPPGTTLQTKEIQNYGNLKQNTHESDYCIDAAGNISPLRDLGYVADAYFPHYYEISFIVLLILDVLVFAVIFGCRFVARRVRSDN